MAQHVPIVSPASDGELLARARDGDEAAFGVLYRRHVGAATAVARSMMRGSTDVDDLVADVFTRVWELLRSGRGHVDAFRPYVMTAVRHACIDRARRTREVTTADFADEVDTALLDAAAVEDDCTLAGRASEMLPERWRLVLQYTHVEGRSSGEVAVLLGVPSSAVPALTYRAREGLRQAFLQAHVERSMAADRCPYVERLGAFVRRGLSVRRHEEVAEHVDRCCSCRSLLAELVHANRRLAAVPGAFSAA
jgi:RNA polymerase sigma factor (sigma-70 family)